MNGLKKQSLQSQDLRRAIVMFSVMAKALTANFHHLIGFHTLHLLHGRMNQPMAERMVSGSSTGSRQNSQISTGRTVKFRRIFSRHLSSGQIAALMVSVSMWHMVLLKISQSHSAVCPFMKVWNSAVIRARVFGAIAMKSLLSIKSGARFSISTTHHALQLLKHMFTQSVYRSMQAPRL